MNVPFDPNNSAYLVEIHNGPQDGNTYLSGNRWEDYYYKDQSGVHFYRRVCDERANYWGVVPRRPRLRRLLANWLRRLMGVG